jgi:hypothetical protein
MRGAVTLLIASAPAAFLAVAVVVVLVFAIAVVAFSSGMLIATVVHLAPWLDVVADVYSTWAVRLGISSVTTVPGGWHV